MNNVIVHVGFPKTGTTWIQEEVFWKDNTRFLNLLTHGEVDDLILKPHPFCFDASEARKKIVQRIETARAAGLRGVISAEFLCGNPFFGGREAPLYAQRIKRVFDKPKIVITIRRQDKMIKSIYKQYIRRGGTLTADEMFFNSRTPGYFSFDYCFLKYDLYVDYMVKIFHDENVIVLPYELFIDSPLDFLKRLFLFSDVDDRISEGEFDLGKRHGESASDHTVPVLRRLNRLRGGEVTEPQHGPLHLAASGLYRAFEWAGKHLPGRQSGALSEFCEATVKGKYTQGNRRLQQWSSVDLEPYGYFDL